MVAVEAKSLLAAEAKKNQATSSPGVYGGKLKTASVKNDKSYPIKHIDSRKEVASQFDISQGTFLSFLLGLVTGELSIVVAVVLKVPGLLGLITA